MTNEQHKPDEDVLEEATQALLKEPVLVGPSPELMAITVAALEGAVGESSTITPLVAASGGAVLGGDESEKKAQMFRVIRWSGLAAAAALVIGAISLRGVWERGGSVAFGQVVENIKRATSVTFTAKEYIGPFSNDHPLLVNFYLQGDFMRQEVPGNQATTFTRSPGSDGSYSVFSYSVSVPGKPIFVVDVINRKSLDVTNINFATSTVAKYKLNQQALQRWFILPDALALIEDKEPQLIGEETIEGRKMLVYRLGKSFFPTYQDIAEDETAKAWIDSETLLPVRLLLKTNHKSQHVDQPSWVDTIDLIDFVWNKPLDPNLFRLEIPRGFKVSDKMPGMSESAK